MATVESMRPGVSVADGAVAESCGEYLQALLAASPGVLGAVMAWVDGRAFASAFQASHAVEAARIAAVSSSLLALSESFSGEALGGRARYSSIVTDRGSIVTARVPSRAQAHVVCVWADESENFATALRYALDAAGKLARIVDKVG